MSKKTEKERDRIAYHEAGHAVIDCLFNLPFNTVSIRKAGREVFELKNGKKLPVRQVVTEGITWPKDRKESVNKNIFNGLLDLREALSNMAGALAEQILIGERDDMVVFGAQNDIQGIVGSCRAAISPGKKIDEWQVSIMVEFIISGVAKQVEVLLKENWSSVQAVANALLKNKRLTFAEVEKLIIKKKGR